MILLFEEYHYSLTTLEEALEGYAHLLTMLSHNEAKVQCVGYFYSVEKGDSVFILPKVFIKEKDGAPLAFGRYKPEDIIYIQEGEAESEVKRLIENGDNGVIFELSVWIYRAIAQFVNRKDNENIINDIVIQNPVSANGEKSQTLLDTILQLIDFHKKHRNLFTYISIVNSSGNNKIHWSKTISKTQPIVKDNNPYYIEFKNKSKVCNFDEELIVLFYSTLAYLSDTYNFRIKSNVQYRLLSPHKIKDLIDYEGGTRLLKRIRRKYFTDELVSLWKLLYAFFEKAEQIESHKCHEDRLLVKNFNLVFEDMIDFLIGSKVGQDVPYELKNQPDGKIVDHIYPDNSLIDNNKIYYVGDSKYYSDDSEVGKNSIYKQFTYAKNVIQFNIDLLNDKLDCLRYRDDLTEGYNITPNFFIRGIINNTKMSYGDDEIKPVMKDGKELVRINKHFYNRLFDRDTLILREYNINFLYVLSTYAINIESNSCRDKLRARFRNDLIESLNSSYVFYKVRPKGALKVKDIVKNHFYDFVGRMYVSEEDENCIWVALEREASYLEEDKKNYPSINLFDSDAEISLPLKVGTRMAGGYEEKYFLPPIWVSENTLYSQDETMPIAAETPAEYKA